MCVCVCVCEWERERERERENHDGKSITDGENFTLDKWFSTMRCYYRQTEVEKGGSELHMSRSEDLLTSSSWLKKHDNNY